MRSRLLFTSLAVVAALLTSCAPNQPETIRVLTYNIHHGAGMDGQIDLQRIARVVREAEADLVALQEVDRGVRRTQGVDQPARLAALTGLQVVFEKNIEHQGGEYGNAVLSRFPIESHENHYLPRSVPGEQRGLLEVHLRVNGRKLLLFATHLDHRPDDGERMASITMLRGLTEQLRDVPVIVAGDLNAVPDSRVIVEARCFLQDAFDDGSGTGLTYPADQPVRRIDYVLHNRHPALTCLECRVIAEPVASDHRPVLAVFQLR